MCLHIFTVHVIWLLPVYAGPHGPGASTAMRWTPEEFANESLGLFYVNMMINGYVVANHRKTMGKSWVYGILLDFMGFYGTLWDFIGFTIW